MRIEQALVLKSFEDSFHKRWRTHKVTKRNEPMIVFGCFHQKQVDIIADWEALVVVVWVGSDSMYLRNNTYGVDYTKILHAPHVRHVAISKWIIDDLSACGVPHIYLPITHVDFEQFKPTPLGAKVYYYIPGNRLELYGNAVVKQVKKELPDIEFINTSSYNEIPHEMINQLYDQCFIGLRPTSHDGQPTTIAEMGLMGRKVIHNGLSPACISWENIYDIVDNIKFYQKSIGSINYALSTRVYKFLDIGEDWLYTKFYNA